MSTARALIARYDELGQAMTAHLEGPVESDHDGDPRYLVCGCVVTSFPDVEERCDVFVGVARERSIAHAQMLEIFPLLLDVAEAAERVLADAWFSELADALARLDRGASEGA